MTDLPEPCQPIGCDNGYHLTGCFYAAVDEPYCEACGHACAHQPSCRILPTPGGGYRCEDSAACARRRLDDMIPADVRERLP